MGESKLKAAQNKAQKAVDETNKKIEELGKHAEKLNKELNSIQELFDKIRNVPNEHASKFKELKKVRLKWEKQAKKIEKDYNDAVKKAAGKGAAGAAGGVAIAALGPTAAMGIATTFGVASTGTAIAALHGAAATNAALAWLGGGALAVGGGGMAAGEAFLALAGPVGWTIAGVSLIVSGIFLWRAKSDNECIENVFALIGERDVKSYNLAIVELNERIKRIDEESKMLRDAIGKIRTFGLDYDKMTKEQQYTLASYVNLMESSTQLLVDPIKGLQPKYTQDDFKQFILCKDKKADTEFCKKYEIPMISLANLLYKINLNDREKTLLWKSLRNNKKVLKSMNVSKREFNIDIISVTLEALKYRYA